MPRRDDLNHILVIGSGPIVIGQACEFDYSGTQACRVLKQEGIRVSLVNSNPATIMTDPEFADSTYVQPITAEYIEKIFQKKLLTAIPLTPYCLPLVAKLPSTQLLICMIVAFSRNTTLN